MARTSTLLVVAGVTVVASFAAYAAYFDYKRRNDPSFRKKLKKEHKKVDKYVKLDASTSSIKRPEYDLKTALEQIQAEAVPPTAEEKEKYFMDNVAMGEQLSQNGPAFEFPAALAFFRALRVYPAPVELIMIYQKSVPEPIFKIVMELTNFDVSSAVDEGDDGIDEDTDNGAGASSATGSRSASRRGPPSETSSQEWDKLTDPGPPSASD